MKIKRNIYLTGFMGTGKSTIGRELARFLGKKFVDIDALIEKREDMPVSRIFEKHGEEYFRNLEMEVAVDLSGQTGRVVATGGGTFLNKEIRELFFKTGLVICLFTEKEQLIKRLKRTEKRPLLKGDKAAVAEKVEKLLDERKEVYSKFSIRVNTTNLTPQEVAKKIIDTLKTYRKILDKLHKQYIVIS
ncbi:MAG: shikimate kinase [Candidatus Eremiobacteraeota bacterium]|nr:shikimate kinase [Candidatus Eremiobacteraeota bacterium]